MNDEYDLTGLDPKAKAWYNKMIEDADFEAHEIELLRAAAFCLDRAEKCRKAIKKHGITFLDRYQNRRKSPEIQMEIDQKTLFLRIIKQLKMETDEPGNY